MVKVFSIPAFFIVLREVLEACVVVGIVLAYLKKTGTTQYSKYVWIGAFSGVGLSLALGIAFGIVYWVNDNSLFEGNAEKIFEGVTFLVAAVLLTWMILWIMSMGKKLQQSLEGKVEKIIEDDESTSRRKKILLVGLVGFQVLREGIETFIFITANAGAEDQGGWRAIPIPGILAIIVGLVASYLVFRGMLELDIIKFFYWSSVILVFFAAGLVSYAFHEIQEVDAFGDWEPSEPETGIMLHFGLPRNAAMTRRTNSLPCCELCLGIRILNFRRASQLFFVLDFAHNNNHCDELGCC